MSTDWRSLATVITEALHLDIAPVAITFADDEPAGISGFDAPMSEPAADGRSGRVPAGCVFWVHAAARTFSTAPEDHGKGRLNNKSRLLSAALSSSEPRCVPA